MTFTAGGRFPRARLEPPRSPKPLTVGSQDSCCSRRSRRLTLQPFELVCKKRTFTKFIRSEERRVGKECRYRWATGADKKAGEEAGGEGRVHQREVVGGAREAGRGGA